MRVSRLLVLSISTILSVGMGQAHAIDIESFEKAQRYDEMVTRRALHNTGQGIYAANRELQKREQALLFCPPSHLSPASLPYANIFDKALRSYRRQSDYSAERNIGSLLLDGLVNRYPCN